MYFESCDFIKLYKSVLTGLLRQGSHIKSRNGEAIELLGCTIAYLGTRRITLPLHIDAEFVDSFAKSIIAGDTDCSNIRNMSAKALSIASAVPGEAALAAGLPANFNALYGPRYASQKQNVLDELCNNEQSRRAIIQILNPSDMLLLRDETWQGEFACTIAWQTFLRNNQLVMQAHMRSQSAYGIWPIDAYILQAVQADLLGALRVRTGALLDAGPLLFTIGSLHAFKREMPGMLRLCYASEHLTDVQCA